MSDGEASRPVPRVSRSDIRASRGRAILARAGADLGGRVVASIIFPAAPEDAIEKTERNIPNMPARNPWLTDSVYPVSHVNSAATDAVPFPGPTGGRKLSREQVKAVPVLFVSNPTIKKVGRDIVVLAPGTLGIQKIIATGDAFELVTSLRVPGARGARAAGEQPCHRDGAQRGRRRAPRRRRRAARRRTGAARQARARLRDGRQRGLQPHRQGRLPHTASTAAPTSSRRATTTRRAAPMRVCARRRHRGRAVRRRAPRDAHHRRGHDLRRLPGRRRARGAARPRSRSGGGTRSSRSPTRPSTTASSSTRRAASTS